MARGESLFVTNSDSFRKRDKMLPDFIKRRLHEWETVRAVRVIDILAWKLGVNPTMIPSFDEDAATMSAIIDRDVEFFEHRLANLKQTNIPDPLFRGRCIEVSSRQDSSFYIAYRHYPQGYGEHTYVVERKKITDKNNIFTREGRRHQIYVVGWGMAAFRFDYSSYVTDQVDFANRDHYRELWQDLGEIYAGLQRLKNKSR